MASLESAVEGGMLARLRPYGFEVAESSESHRGSSVRLANGATVIAVSADWLEGELEVAAAPMGEEAIPIHDLVPPEAAHALRLRRLPRDVSTNMVEVQLARVADLLLRHQPVLLGRVSYEPFSSGTQHLGALQAGDRTALVPFFRARVAEYDHAFRHDEFVTVGLFDELTQLSSGIAFDLLPAAVEITVAARDGSLFDPALCLLSTLADASDTTEMPDALVRSWPEIRSTVEARLSAEPSSGRDMRLTWESLRAHYRRP